MRGGGASRLDPRTGEPIHPALFERPGVARIGNAFSIDLDRDAVQHRHHAADECGAARIGCHAHRDRGVEFDEVQTGIEQTIDARQAVAGMFEPKLHTVGPQLPRQFAHASELVYRGAFADFDPQIARTTGRLG